MAKIACVATDDPDMRETLTDDFAQRIFTFDHHQIARWNPPMQKRRRDAACAAAKFNHIY